MCESLSLSLSLSLSRSLSEHVYEMYVITSPLTTDRLRKLARA